MRVNDCPGVFVHLELLVQLELLVPQPVPLQVILLSLAW